MNLFVWASDRSLDGDRVKEGYAVREWSDGGLQFAAVSDIPPAELAQFEDLYRRAAFSAADRKG